MALTWQTGLQSVANSVSGVLSNVVGRTKDFFSTGFKNNIENASTLFKNGVNVVGINVNGIPEMKRAIETYVTDVYNALDALSSKDSGIAFKGEYKKAIDEYILACIEACECIASNMLAFQDELTKVQAAYENKDRDIASAIRSDAESTRSTYTRYSSMGSSTN